MISALIFIFNAIVNYVLGFKCLQSFRKNQINVITRGFIGLGFFTGLAFTFYLADVLVKLSNLNRLSVIFHTLAVALLFFAMIQAALLAGEMISKPRLGKVIATVLGVLGVYTVFWYFQAPETTRVLSFGIAEYPDVPIVKKLYSICILLTYNWLFVVFLSVGLKNKENRYKFLLLAFSFFVPVWGGVGLLASTQLWHYLVTYTILFIGYVLRLAGITIHVRSVDKTPSLG